MINFALRHQERYSRKELLLRSFFGIFYIIIPHLFLLYFLAIANAFIRLISLFTILLTGVFPEKMFDFQVGFLKWALRLHTRVYHLSDGYPAFGLNEEDSNMTLDIDYPENVSRKLTLLRFLLGGFYVGIPHGVVLFFRLIACMVLNVIAFWAILFSGKYPKGMFDFQVETLRWIVRVHAYLAHMTDEYPPFTGKPIQEGEIALDQI